MPNRKRHAKDELGDPNNLRQRSKATNEPYNWSIRGRIYVPAWSRSTLLLGSVRQTFVQTVGVHRKHLQYMKPKREIQLLKKKHSCNHLFDTNVCSIAKLNLGKTLGGSTGEHLP
jgi:hypothetical protein